MNPLHTPNLFLEVLTQFISCNLTKSIVHETNNSTFDTQKTRLHTFVTIIYENALKILILYCFNVAIMLFKLLAPELFFLILAHPVYKM